MARAYAQYTTSIWNDDDFRELTPEQQALYFLLRGQAEITAAGVLPLRSRRWSRMARGWTPERVEEVIAELEAQGHVTVDETTEELLVVKFVKWDGGYTNSKRIPVIRDSALAIESARLRSVLARELFRLGLSDMASLIAPDTHPDNPSDSPSNQPRDTPPDSPSDREPRFDRVGVKQGDHQSNPQPATRNPQPGDRAEPEAPSTSLALLAPPTLDQPTAQTIVTEWIDRCQKRPPERVIGQIAKSTREMLAEGIDPDDIRRGLSTWMTKPVAPSLLPAIVNEVMNAAPTGKPRHQAETDALFERAARRIGATL